MNADSNTFDNMQINMKKGTRALTQTVTDLEEVECVLREVVQDHPRGVVSERQIPHQPHHTAHYSAREHGFSCYCPSSPFEIVKSDLTVQYLVHYPHDPMFLLVFTVDM